MKKIFLILSFFLFSVVNVTAQSIDITQPDYSQLNGYNVKLYGVKGDGVTNDAAALNALVSLVPAGSTIWFPPGTYKLYSGVTTSKRLIYKSTGAILSTTASIQFFQLTSGAENSEFSGFTFEGNDVGAGQAALYFNGCGKFVVYDNYFKDFGNAAIVATNIENSNELGGTINNNKFVSNNTAISLLTRGEYVNITSCTFLENTIAIQSAAGNTNIHGCIIAYNTTGVKFTAGVNNGHGVISGCEINHNSFPVDFTDVDNGFTFTGNHIITGTLSIKTSTGIAISSGVINVDAFTFSNTVGCSFSDVGFTNSLANTISLTGTSPIYVNCYKLNGDIAIDGDNFITGSVVKYTLTGSATLDFPSTAAQADSDLTITVTGAADGDPVIVGPVNAATISGGSFSAWVSAANTVTVRFSNYSAAAIDPASGTFKVTVFKN